MARGYRALEQPILDLSKKGLEVTGAALEQIERGAAIASGLPKPK